MVVRLLGLSVGLSALTACGLARFNDLALDDRAAPAHRPRLRIALLAAQETLTAQAIAETFRCGGRRRPRRRGHVDDAARYAQSTPTPIRTTRPDPQSRTPTTPVVAGGRDRRTNAVLDATPPDPGARRVRRPGGDRVRADRVAVAQTSSAARRAGRRRAPISSGSRPERRCSRSQIQGFQDNSSSCSRRSRPASTKRSPDSRRSATRRSSSTWRSTR